MTLFVAGLPLIDPNKVFADLASFFEVYASSFETGSHILKAKEVITISSHDKTLYVSQREFAIISGDPSSMITTFGSDMATTCHIVVVYHKDTKIAALGHFDGANTKQGVNDMLNGIVKEIVSQLQTDDMHLVGLILVDQYPQSEIYPKGLFYHLSAVSSGDFHKDLDLHIVGGFRDGRCLSEQLTIELLKEFHQYNVENGSNPVRIHLKTLCASSLNNTEIENHEDKFSHGMIQSPVIFGIVFDAKTGELTPAVFEENAKLPVPDVRSARSLMGVKFMPNIYRIHDGTFVLNPFTYDEFEQIELWLKQPDHIIRKYMSTSPEVEPSNFCDHIRSTLKFIYNNPDPKQSVFCNEKALVYRAKIVQGCLTWEAV